MSAVEQAAVELEVVGCSLRMVWEVSVAETADREVAVRMAKAEETEEVAKVVEREVSLAASVAEAKVAGVRGAPVAMVAVAKAVEDSDWEGAGVAVRVEAVVGVARAEAVGAEVVEVAATSVEKKEVARAVVGQGAAAMAKVLCK